MKKKLRFLLIIFLGVFMTSYAQAANIAWTGLGADTDWQTAGNWDSGVPGSSDNVTIAIDATITSNTTTTVTIQRLTVTAVVTLNLNLTVDASHHAVSATNGTLNFGDFTFALSTSATNRMGLRATGTGSSINVSANTTITISGVPSRAIRIESDNTMTNNGSITIDGYTVNGVQAQASGIINNNGSITINGLASATNQGIIIAGTLNNNTGSSITITDPITIINQFTVTGTGVNDGQITLSGGDTDTRVNVSGSMTNNACGIIDMGDGRAFVNGTFENKGLLKTSYADVSAAAGTGTATNSGFVISTGAGSTTWDKVAGATATDNGQFSTSSPLNFAIDAGGTCASADIGIDAAHSWYNDAAKTTLVGANDATGALTTESAVFAGAGPHTLYSCYGADVTMTLSNLSGACLPVELISFEGTRKDNHVELTWVTASEENNYGFEIERAYKNGAELKWEVIDFVEGNGTTFETQTYSYQDVRASQGTNYYRLKQLDLPTGQTGLDGQFEYSNVVSVDLGQGSDIFKVKVSPNPVRTQLILEDGIGQVTIFNIMGQPVKKMQVIDVSHSISLEDLPNGQYIIHVQKEDGTIGVQQFLKVEK